MTVEEKAANDRFLERYQLTEVERLLSKFAFRRCLQCESPADEFGAAANEDLPRAAGHLMTPVFIDAAVGGH